MLTMAYADNADRMLSLTSTRDNFVRHALTSKKCPICAEQLVIGQRISCSSGFTIGQAEIDEHEAAMGSQH
jgi:hypothetical protein